MNDVISLLHVTTQPLPTPWLDRMWGKWALPERDIRKWNLHNEGVRHTDMQADMMHFAYQSLSVRRGNRLARYSQRKENIPSVGV